MRIRIKKTHHDAVIPKYAHFGDAAVDLTAVRTWEDEFGNTCYGTGLAMENLIIKVPTTIWSETESRSLFWSLFHPFNL